MITQWILGDFKFYLWNKSAMIKMLLFDKNQSVCGSIQIHDQMKLEKSSYRETKPQMLFLILVWKPHWVDYINYHKI